MCYECESDLHEKPSIACDQCLNWVHWECHGLKSQPNSVYWYCKNCKLHNRYCIHFIIDYYILEFYYDQNEKKKKKNVTCKFCNSSVCHFFFNSLTEKNKIN